MSRQLYDLMYMCVCVCVPSALQICWRATSLLLSSAGRWRFSLYRPSTCPPYRTWLPLPHEGNHGGLTRQCLHTDRRWFKLLCKSWVFTAKRDDIGDGSYDHWTDGGWRSCPANERHGCLWHVVTILGLCTSGDSEGFANTHLGSRRRRASQSPRPATWGWQEASAPSYPERKCCLSSSPL